MSRAVTSSLLRNAAVRAMIGIAATTDKGIMQKIATSAMAFLTVVAESLLMAPQHLIMNAENTETRGAFS